MRNKVNTTEKENVLGNNHTRKVTRRVKRFVLENATFISTMSAHYEHVEKHKMRGSVISSGANVEAYRSLRIILKARKTGKDYRGIELTSIG